MHVCCCYSINCIVLYCIVLRIESKRDVRFEFELNLETSQVPNLGVCRNSCDFCLIS